MDVTPSSSKDINVLDVPGPSTFFPRRLSFEDQEAFEDEEAFGMYNVLLFFNL